MNVTFLLLLCLSLTLLLGNCESSWKQLYYESSSSSYGDDDIFVICTNNEEEVSILESIEKAILSDDEIDSTPGRLTANKRARNLVTTRPPKDGLTRISKDKGEPARRLTLVQALELGNPPLMDAVPSTLQTFLLPSDALTTGRTKPVSRVVRLKVPRSNSIFQAKPTLNVDNSSALDRIVLLRFPISIDNQSKKGKKRSEKKEKPSKASAREEESTVWINQFLESHPDHGLFAVPRDYLIDNFNLANLPEILGISSECFRIAWRTLLHESYHKSHEIARYLFFLIHQRFILSPRGLHLASRRKCFGRCPSPDCGSHTVPIGHSNLPGKGVAFEYCGKCQKQWVNWSWQDDPIVDGCAWGTTFAHLLWLVYGLPRAKSHRSPKEPPYVPRIYGFKLHWSAGQYL